MGAMAPPLLPYPSTSTPHSSLSHFSTSFFFIFPFHYNTILNNNKKNNVILRCPMGVYLGRTAHPDIPPRHPPTQHLLSPARNPRLHGLPPGYRTGCRPVSQRRQGPSAYSSALGPSTLVCPCHVPRRWFLRKYVFFVFFVFLCPLIPLCPTIFTTLLSLRTRRVHPQTYHRKKLLIALRNN